ncbi:MAG: WecB/TagA/CpsF family glycosyltransferase [Coriobacteriia bacterium]|jgi:N-acetylglucosaminyldiphosphoundecaprenol N-acetyl-beta-D-mannosaminyltransferase|nr:WecB/TagA/CpsF family glycosyltransferase [Coriobacteriia bacterium]
MRGEIFGVPLDLLTMDETVDACVELAERQQAAQHVVLNAGKVIMMHDDRRLHSVVSGCDIVSADGQSIVWAGRVLGLDVPERVAGIDLMARLLAEAEQRGWPVYFLGARDEVLESCVTRLTAQHPRLVVAGQQNGYFDDGWQVARTIKDSHAKLVFVGISSPKKEYFLAEHLRDMGPVFAMGVGGSFDVIAGVTRRAPAWMQRSGLEWFYRFAQEPRRMWRRYLVGNARFIGLVMREKVRGKPAVP